MPGTVSASFAQKLANQRELVRQDAVRLLEKAQRQGRDTLTEDEEAEFQALKATMQALSDSENSTLAELRELRTGPALAVADLLILHPNTWSAVRRTKDGFDRYLTQPDPTSGEAASIWGVPVLTTISCPDDTGVLLDTTKFGPGARAAGGAGRIRQRRLHPQHRAVRRGGAPDAGRRTPAGGHGDQRAPVDGRGRNNQQEAQQQQEGRLTTSRQPGNVPDGRRGCRGGVSPGALTCAR
jgi:hypothetical protein